MARRGQSSETASSNKLHARFRAHLRANVGVAAIILAVSLGIGMTGYHFLADLPWIDAFLNASMLLSGMGPVAELRSDGAKLFAGAYAIYCGVVFIATAGILLAPVGSHILHKFHLDKDK
jgi:hypothetical protein